MIPGILVCSDVCLDTESGEMVLIRNINCVLPEGLRLASSTCSSSAVTPALGGSHASGLYGHLHSHAHTHT